MIKPARCVGTSGVEHKFSFLAGKKGRVCAVDLYKEVGQVEVLKTFLKEMDTSADVVLVCLSGRPSAAGTELAKEYGLKIVGPGEIGKLFEELEARVSPEMSVVSR